VHGRLKEKSGTFTSYLTEDEDYVMHSHGKTAGGKLAQTDYTVIKETPKFSLVKINLVTGRKNQIRVHFADHGHPVVGDGKYREGPTKYKRLALHSHSISFPHPFSRERLTFEAPVPDHFKTLVGEWEKG
jgi:tRNA pseudouridine32 synthase/23S rRNA pseudouridine746 synthase/23S rRNA pseudouridine1911/1915/1917 synthase